MIIIGHYSDSVSVVTVFEIDGAIYFDILSVDTGEFETYSEGFWL